MQKCKCTQCGATDFTREGNEFLRCAYCSSLFKMEKPEVKSGGAKVIIGKGANVVFGSTSNVTINGELIIENGANVSFLGKIHIIEKSDTNKIEEARLKLQKEKQ
jgi:hypothetical protein